MLTAMTESTSAQLRWSAQAMMPNQEYPYKVMYREKGKSWKSQKVSMPYAKVIGLKRGRTYIYKVGVACGLNAANSTSVFGEDSYVYSTEQEFTTTDQIDEKSQVQCGVKPEIRIKNTEPLQDNLYPNTTFRAGDFPVTVLNATGSNGVYSGEGYVKVPYLQDTKIKVVFNGIKLNTERQLIDGKLVTTYDETERNVVEIKRLDEVINDLKSIFKKKKNTVEDVKSLQELKKLWDFYLSNADEIGISDEDKEKFKSLGEGMFSASVEKLSKEERKALLANTEKAEKLYDKHKNKFEQYIAKKEQEANNNSQINEIVEALLNLKGKAFLKCKKCEEKSIHHTGDKNGVIVDLNIGKYNFKCILGEYHPENNADIITLLRKKESSVSKNETPTTKVKQYIKNIQDKKDSFLLIAQENSDLLECTNRLTFPENFCSVKETETITKEDEKYIIEELKNCLNNNQAVISSDELKNIEKDLLEIKKQLHKEQAFEWTYKGKIYKLNAKNKVEEVQNPLSNAEIIKGIWKGEQEEKMRFYRNEEGIIQLSAFGYRSDLPIVEGKKANLEEISKHILNQTNDYFSDLRTPSQQAPQLDEDAFADGKKIEIGKNATKFQVFIEGVGLTKTLLKTGKVEAKVYLDKSPEESKIKAPGVVTGSLEAGLTVVTDITGMVVMIYDIAVDKKVREETYNGLVKIKDEIKENPKELFPILKEIVLEAATGNSSADWQEASQEQTDKGKQSHLLSKGAVRTVITVVVSGKIITELPEISKKIAAKMANLKNAAKVIKKLPDNIQAILNDVARFSPQILDEMKIFLSKIDFNILEKLCKAKGFDKVLSDMALHWKKFRGGKFQIEYAKKLLTEGRIISFEVSDLSNDLTRIYDIVVESFENGEHIIKQLELKNWSLFYPETIKNQFLKDLQKMKNLGDIQWIFAKTDNIRDLDILKSKVLQALKTADGKPIKELEKISTEQTKKLFPEFKDVINNNNKNRFLLEKLNEDDFFKKIFQIAE